MQKLHKGVLIVTSTLILIVIGISFFLGPISLTGLVIYEGACGGFINSEGFYELNSSLSCSSGDGIKINSSNIKINCNSYSITGGSDVNSNGILVSSNLTNVTIQFCNISSFYNIISVNSNTNLNIKNSTAIQNNSCVIGNWTDLGGNTGCFDTTGPSLFLSNQTIYSNNSLSYQILASDPSGISNYSINDNANFSVSSSGLLKNITSLAIINYIIKITATDIRSYSSSELFNLNVQTTPQPDDDSSDDGSSDDDDNDGSSESSPSSESNLKECTEQQAWECTEWGDCINNIQKRNCLKKDQKCNTPLPATNRDCTVIEESNSEETEAEGPVEEIEVSGNINEAAEITGSAITGGVISPLQKPLQILKNNPVPFIAGLILVVGFILTIVLGYKRKKARSSLKLKETQKNLESKQSK